MFKTSLNLLDFDKKEFNCFIAKINYERKQALEYTSFLYIITGNGQIILNNEIKNLKEDSIILINANDVYEIESETGLLALTLQFNPKKILKENLRFNCYFFNANENEISKKIVKKLVYILNNTLTNNSYNFNLSLLYDFIYQLELYFKSDFVLKPNKYHDRIESIRQYIETNYQKRITLQMIATHEHLSVSYVSNFIKKWFNRPFLSYYNDVRIDYALKDLLQSDLTIEQIAYQNGFDDPRSFVSVFKKRYQMLPSVYRNIHKNDKNTNKILSKEENELYQEVLLKLKPLINEKKELVNIDLVKAKTVVKANNLDVLIKHTTLNNALHMFTGVAAAHDILLADVQDMLKRINQEIGFKYIKFHGLLSDEMSVYKEDSNGVCHYNYFFVDKVLDFLISIGIKPLLEIGFMPKDLALHQDKLIFNGRYLASRPKDLTKWKDFIENLMQHLLNKYGTLELESWLFTIWNQPDSGESLFGMGSDVIFFEFFKATYESIKKVLPNAKIGSPSCFISDTSSYTFLEKFLLYTTKHNMKLDFINGFLTFDCFDVVSDKNTVLTRSLFQKDPNYFHKSLVHTKAFLQRLNYDNIPFYLSTFIFNSSHRNLINDTCFKSCHLVKNFLENYNQFDGIGSWCLTDLNGESALSDSLFHGGIGMFTRNGIEKSIYNSLVLLSKLGHDVLYQGDGYFISKSYKRIFVMLYNYVHYSDMFASGDIILDQNNRYLPFNMNEKKSFSLELTNLNVSEVLIKEYTVNKETGSSYDFFMRMGNIELKDNDEFNYLKKHASYSLNLKKQAVINNKLLLEAQLLPLEIRLIEIKL